MNRQIVFLVLLSIAFSCSDTPVDVQPPTNIFSLSITVTDNANNSVPNLRVSAWNKLPYDNYLMPKIQTIKGTQSSSTKFEFALKEKSQVNLIAYDLEDTLYDSIISSELNPGNYKVIWQNSEPNRVYKVVFKAIVDSLIDSLNFCDSIYAVNHTIDPQEAAIGQTDINGKFETKNKLLFPRLYELPEFNRTGFNGPEVIGAFSFLDTIVIALSDTVNNKIQYYDFLFKDGENKVSLHWNPPLSKSFEAHSRMFKINTTSFLDSIDPIGVPMKNDFRQNYPNPFNWF